MPSATIVPIVEHLRIFRTGRMSWTGPEEAIMRERWGIEDVDFIQLRLLAVSGIMRSLIAIRSKSRYMGLKGDMHGYYTAAETAKELGLARLYIYVLIRQRKLHAILARGRYLITVSEVARLSEIYAAQMREQPVRSIDLCEAARRLGYCIDHIRNLLQIGILRGCKRKGKWLCDAEQVQEVAAEMLRKCEVRRDWGKRMRG